MKEVGFIVIATRRATVQVEYLEFHPADPPPEHVIVTEACFSEVKRCSELNEAIKWREEHNDEHSEYIILPYY